MKRVGLAVMVAWLGWGTGCAARAANSTGESLGEGLASYYGPGLHGRPTASGERFDMHALTAAHRTLGFGSCVRVVNQENGRSVEVRVNDRGPFKKGRVIDVSLAAAKKLGLVEKGLARVRLYRCGTAG